MDEKLEEQSGQSGKKSGMSPKIFLIGLPLFIVQLIAVYFVTANFLIQRDVSHEIPPDSGITNEETEVLGHFIHPLNDIIVNPADTKGQRLMLLSLGFDVALEEEKKLLEEKEIIIKDMLISTLAKKTLQELSDIRYKDTLKSELTRNIRELLPELKLNNIYFSKYIIN